MASKSEKQWGGRFRKEVDRLTLFYSESISYDWRLYPYDVAGGMAYARMLGECGIIKKGEANKIVKALRQIRKELDKGEFDYDVRLEDIHTNIEAALIEKVGADIGGKLHTGRSRNDQVTLDMRMYIRDEAVSVVDLIRGLQTAIVRLAEENSEVIMPGFTHLQHAQPVLFAHHMLAYYEMLKRDTERFRGCYRVADVMPLGSAALGGTSFAIDRKMLAKELGFEQISNNSMDAVSDRDYLVEFLSACAILMMHLSRLSEELVIWSSPEFGFIEIDDAFTTGSSIMPQKKNPDVAELARAKAARAYGNLMTLLGIMKALPLTYNRDLQEDKPCVFDSADIVVTTLHVFASMMAGLTVFSDRMEEMCRLGFLNATDMADYLVAKGMPFRRAHGVVGKVVTYCLKELIPLEDLPLKKLQSFSPLFSKNVYDVLRLDKIVNSRRTAGGTARPNVLREIKKAKAELDL